MPVDPSLIQAVRTHAHEHYNAGGWDFVVETMDDSDIAAELARAGATTGKAAIASIGKLVALWDERRREIQGSEGW